MMGEPAFVSFPLALGHHFLVFGEVLESSCQQDPNFVIGYQECDVQKV